MRFSLRHLAAVTCLAIVSVDAAGTESARSPARLTVSIQDLDFSRPESIPALYARIQAAAARVCRAEMTYFYLRAARVRRECRDFAVADAVERANLPQLSALHRDASRGTSRRAGVGGSRR